MQSRIAQQEKLAQLGAFLGASSEKTGHTESSGTAERICDPVSREYLRKVSTIFKEAFHSVSVPGLSLKHEGEEHRSSNKDKDSNSKNSITQHVQGHASGLLARELLIGVTEPLIDIDTVPGMLLNNVYESFAVLVISRLRAYSHFLAHQGVSLAKDPSVEPTAMASTVEQRIEAVMETGTQVSIESVETRFEILQDPEEKTATTLPFEFQVEMNLLVPRASCDQEVVHVSLAAPGQIIGTFDFNLNVFQQVKVDIDTHDLLSQMMKQASHIVGVVAALSDTDLSSQDNDGDSKILRSESCAAMPPPLPQLTAVSSKRGLHLLSKAAEEAERPIVSPDLCALDEPTTIYHSIPYIYLEKRGACIEQDEQADEDDEDFGDLAQGGQVSTLSPDQCADIIDCVFGDIDDDMLMGAPPPKKRKI